MLKANARVALASAAAALVVASAAGEPEAVAAYAVVDGERVAVPDVPMGEAAVVRAILEEGIGNSRVLEHLYVLCAEHGPRLTGSTRQEQAAAWAAGRFAAWGLDRAELWKWGEIATRFDRGPSGSVERFMPTCSTRPCQWAPRFLCAGLHGGAAAGAGGDRCPLLVGPAGGPDALMADVAAGVRPWSAGGGLPRRPSHRECR